MITTFPCSFQICVETYSSPSWLSSTSHFLPLYHPLCSSFLPESISCYLKLTVSFSRSLPPLLFPLLPSIFLTLSASFSLFRSLSSVNPHLFLLFFPSTPYPSFWRCPWSKTIVGTWGCDIVCTLRTFGVHWWNWTNSQVYVRVKTFIFGLDWGTFFWWWLRFIFCRGYPWSRLDRNDTFNLYFETSMSPLMISL